MDWITVSPKWSALPIEESMERADELKIIVEDEGSISKWCEVLSLKKLDVPVWLHPEWSRSKDQKVLESINHWVREFGFPFRAGFQLHKLYNADASDERSRPEESLSHLPVWSVDVLERLAECVEDTLGANQKEKNLRNGQISRIFKSYLATIEPPVNLIQWLPPVLGLLFGPWCHGVIQRWRQKGMQIFFPSMPDLKR